MNAFACCTGGDFPCGTELENSKYSGGSLGRQGLTGVGVVLKSRRAADELHVAAMHPGGPADVSGRVFENDELISIDYVSTKGKLYEELAAMMLGPPGSTVTLELRRRGQIVIVPLVRGRVDTDKVGGAKHVSVVRGNAQRTLGSEKRLNSMYPWLDRPQPSYKTGVIQKIIGTVPPRTKLIAAALYDRIVCTETLEPAAAWFS